MADEARALDRKVVLITGGSRGVGLATARRLGTEGAAVVLVARDRDHLDSATAALRSDGVRVAGIKGDVTDRLSMARAVLEAERQFGGLDVLINNAGIGRYGPIAEMQPEEWRRVIEVNVLGVFHATRAALPALRRRGGGQIIAISSGAARTGYPNMSAYCTSKAALEGFMRALAAEVAEEPIKVATVIPGSILTDFGVRTREDRQASGQKMLEPEDVAEAIFYLLSQPERAWTQELNLWPR
jgi:NAD(P)-dependent dehydrogenase (short-subunit alcohol dehydrogenase family)